ncbi:unnamed protein product [Ilex paraguariensis]|uniref:Uncharacterized protein n=1 Tax=Ilex paraguariensis TaxID=185542 RepID=A0ABC8U4I8_9AQUA
MDMTIVSHRQDHQMLKDRSESLFSNASTGSSYSCGAEHDDQCKSEIPSLPVRDEEEWEEARCPICIEPPHNAVLLLCSFCDQHCHPYMCDTSYRHSNCLDQFCKSSGAALSTEEVISITAEERESEEWMSSPRTRYNGKQLPQLVCPLCRGQISGWVVIEAARHFMNSKPRSCSLETCDFNGNYSELRKHTRLEHPSVCPSEADPKRLQDWTTLGRERDFEDFFSANSQWFEDEWSDESIFSFIGGTVMDHERDLEGIQSAYQSGFGDSWLDDSDGLMDHVLHPSRFWLNFLSFSPFVEPIELVSSSGGDLNGNSRSIWSRATHYAQSVTPQGSNISQGNSRGLGQQPQLDQRQSREARNSGESGNSRSTRSRATYHAATFPASRRSSNFSWGNSRSLRQHRRLDQRQSRRNH